MPKNSTLGILSDEKQQDEISIGVFIIMKEILYIDICVYTQTQTHTYKMPPIKIMGG